VTLELLHMVADRSGRTDPAERFITKSEVLELLSTPHIASVLSEADDQKLDLECIADGLRSADGQSRLLEDWVSSDSVRLLGCGTGRGKSNALARMQHRMAQRGTVVLVAGSRTRLQLAGNRRVPLAAGVFGCQR
jgi:hypothetical protein